MTESPFAIKRSLFEQIGWIILLVLLLCAGVVFLLFNEIRILGVITILCCIGSVYFLRSRNLLVVTSEGITSYRPLNRKYIPWSKVGTIQASTKNHLTTGSFVYTTESKPYPYLRIQVQGERDVLVPVGQYLNPDGIFMSAEWRARPKRTFEELLAEIEAFRPR